MGLLGGFLPNVVSTLQTKFNLDRTEPEANASLQQLDLASKITQQVYEAMSPLTVQELETFYTQPSIEANKYSSKQQDPASFSIQQAYAAANLQTLDEDLVSPPQHLLHTAGCGTYFR